MWLHLALSTPQNSLSSWFRHVSELSEQLVQLRVFHMEVRVREEVGHGAVVLILEGAIMGMLLAALGARHRHNVTLGRLVLV